MLRLDDAMLEQVRSAAAPIPVYLRAQYLEHIAAALNGHAVTHAAVRLACQQAQRELLGAPVMQTD